MSTSTSYNILCSVLLYVVDIGALCHGHCFIYCILWTVCCEHCMLCNEYCFVPWALLLQMLYAMCCCMFVLWAFLHMWLDLRNAAFHAHNSKAHFHHQMIAAHSTWQFSQILVLKVAQGAFAVACFWGLSDVHECSGGLQMAPSPLDEQIAFWLMSLVMNLAALCDMWRSKWHQWMLFGYFQYWRSLYPPLRGYSPTPSFQWYLLCQ